MCLLSLGNELDMLFNTTILKCFLIIAVIVCGFRDPAVSKAVYASLLLVESRIPTVLQNQCSSLACKCAQCVTAIMETLLWYSALSFLTTLTPKVMTDAH
jgi:hypothetical protein